MRRTFSNLSEGVGRVFFVSSAEAADADGGRRMALVFPSGTAARQIHYAAGRKLGGGGGGGVPPFSSMMMNERRCQTP